MNRKEAITKWFAGPDHHTTIEDVELIESGHGDMGVANYRITFPNEVSDWRMYFDAETGEVIDGYTYQTIMEY